MEEIKTVSWKILQAGQLRSYADSIYEYEIESTIHENRIKEFCFQFLKKVDPKHKGNQFNGSCNFPFGLSSFYSFTKIEDNKYHYKVCSPYTG
ncbi:MAG: hypothetical protein KAS32_01285 [Candidatus Peribacteraceae bacterium]|nr:hypothetical protein [Candidatus Peribacteraceae bacterium]